MCIPGAPAKQDHDRNPTLYYVPATTLVRPTAREVRLPEVTEAHAGVTCNSVCGR